jgi:hypothetical protein
VDREPLLDDLLGSTRKIDALLDEMDAFGAKQVFAFDARRDVLTLLASARDAAHSRVRAAQLTRREHHLISVDSHCSPLPSTPSDDTRPHDD